MAQKMRLGHFTALIHVSVNLYHYYLHNITTSTTAERNVVYFCFWNVFTMLFWNLQTFIANFRVWNENRAWLCDAIFLACIFKNYPNLMLKVYANIIFHSGFRHVQWEFYVKAFDSGELSRAWLFQVVCIYLETLTNKFYIYSKLYDSRVTTTDKSLLVNYLRGNLAIENGKPLEILSKSNVLGLHFISSSSGYGIGKYGFSGTITAGEQMAECWHSDIIIDKWVIAYQLYEKVCGWVCFTLLWKISQFCQNGCCFKQ